MDDWGFEYLSAWLAPRVELPIGPLFCVIDGDPGRRASSGTSVRAELPRLALDAGARRRFAPQSYATPMRSSSPARGRAAELVCVLWPDE
jgi:hypothetical protein